MNFIWEPIETNTLMGTIKLLFLFITPVICIIGLVTNSLVIIIVNHKLNKKELEENQYKFMSVNACCNALILFIQSFDLISECQKVMLDYSETLDGFFCSNARRALFTQFYRIIFLEYLTHVLNIMSNLSYISYSINRLSLIGQEHGKFVTDMSKITLRNYFLKTIFFCLALPVSKIFTFKPNFMWPEMDYPLLFEYRISELKNSLLFLYYISSIIYNLINTFGFTIINLVVDINILFAMKKVIAERHKKKIIASITCQIKKNLKK